MKTIFWNILGIMMVFMLFQSTAYSQDGITGTVFLDEDSDGIYDSDENPVPNVIVVLQDENSNLLASTITGANGAYVFENLPEIVGDFFVSISLPNGTFCTTNVFAVVQYQDGDLVEVDFGLNYITDSPPGLMVGIVWYDINYNGVYDDGEEGFETEIILKNEDGFYLEAVMSNPETGAYVFDNVVDGNYIIEAAAIPTGSILITPQQQEVTMENGEASANTYFGFQPIESTNIDLKISAHAASNTVLGYEFNYTLWVKNDGNDLATGIQVKTVLPDELEFVEFINLDGTYDWDTGIWTCDDVEAGQFGSSYFIMRVKAVAEGNVEWKAEVLAADQFDPDSTPNNMGESPVEDDESIVEIYATEYGSIGDMVWLDTNGDGIQDSNETGIEGVTLELYSGGTLIGTTSTDENGTYLFDELVDGTYTVVVGDGPEGTILTTLPSYTATILFIEVVHAELGDFGFKVVDNTETIDLEIGINELEETVEVGELESYKVFVGNNGSGNASGIEIAVTLPDNLSYVNAFSVLGNYNPITGIWNVGSLVAGGYVELTVLVEGAEEGNAEIIAEVVSANETDLDSTPDNLVDVAIEDDEGVFEVLVIPSNGGSIGDTVFEDADDNGVKDAGEEGIPGVIVTLTYPDGTEESTVTDGTGEYIFYELPEGIYTITVGDGPEGTVPTTPTEHTVDLLEGEDYVDADFGFNEEALGSIGDVVFNDENGNGIQDAGEEGIPGVVMTLTYANGVVETTLTDNEGEYIFDELPESLGIYTVTVGDGPEGYELTTPNDYNVMLAEGEDYVDADFGFALENTNNNGSIGDMVWLDSDGDDVQDPGESGIPNVTVYLQDDTGNVVATTITDNDGMYLFENLADGDYVVFVGDDPSGINVFESFDVTITNGSDYLDADFHFTPIEGIDLEAGINLAAETMEVGESTNYQIFIGNNFNSDEAATNVVVSVTFSDNLSYTFSNTSLGIYNAFSGIWTVGTIESGAYADLNLTLQATDIGDAEIRVEVISVNETDIDSTPNNLGDIAVEDDEGIFDVLVTSGVSGGEGSITGQVETTTSYVVSGAIVSLYNTDGGLLATTYSDDSGEYEFEDLIEGTYVVACTYEDNVVTPLSYEIELDEGESLSDFDFLIGSSSILVWPGDANNDGIANNFDLLNVGLAFDQIGIPRDAVSTEWIEHSAENWAFYFENEVNLKHADCDGSGLVNDLDVEAINLNYGAVHGKTDDENEANEDDPLLALDFPDEPFQTGDVLEIPIRLGDMDNILEGLYGIAFSIEFEEGLFVEESIEIDFSDSWLGMENEDLLTLDRLIDGQVVDIALSRNNQIDISGGGQLAVMRGIIDDIAGKEDFLEFDFVIKNVKAIKADETDIPIFYEDTSIAVGSDGTAVDNIDFGTNTRLYPNPTTDVFNLEFEANDLPKSVAFYSVDGRDIETINDVNNDLTINVATWKSGVYFVEMVFESGSIWHKVVVE